MTTRQEASAAQNKLIAAYFETDENVVSCGLSTENGEWFIGVGLEEDRETNVPSEVDGVRVEVSVIGRVELQ